MLVGGWEFVVVFEILVELGSEMVASERVRCKGVSDLSSEIRVHDLGYAWVGCVNH